MSDTKFPRMHIATSVTNRILQLQAEIAPEPIVNAPTPVVPDSVEAGKQLDLELTQPIGKVAPDDAVIQAAAQGRTPLDGLIDPRP